ncbi:MAG: hypothetical protein IKI76_05575 [Selenomonadaceae bacterium]|nr:hypothetical protein [Selenomonadaceae bacterium]
MKKLFGLCAALLLMCAMIFPAKTFAADDPNSEGIKAYREALSSYSADAEKFFRQDILFTSPYIQAELDILGSVEGNVFRSKGDLTFWIEKDDGTSTETMIPFYMTQEGKDMTIYFKADKEWEKFTAPTLAAGIMDMLATPTPEEVEEFVNDAKEVTILQENENRRIMLITLDGNSMANSFRTRSEANPNSTADPIQEAVVNYFDTAFRNANLWYMWTIDKRDWHTVAMQYQFSGLVQELARAALNDPNQTWPDEINQLLETIAYYSEIRAYTTYPSDAAGVKKNLEIPKKVLKAKSVDSLTNRATK